MNNAKNDQHRKTMKTILVPTDFSKAATNAAEYAANFAKTIKARVVLFNVYHLPVPVSEVPVMVITPSELKEGSEVQLKKTAAYLKKKTGVEVKYIAKMGLAADAILEEGKKAAIIIMGMHGANKLSETLIGSITTSTLRKATVPVLVIPEKAKYKKPKQIVFACDYDPRTDKHTLDALTDFMNVFGSKIYVLNIKQKKELISVEKVKGMKLESKRKNVEHIYYFPEKGNLAEGINEFVRDKKADMVAVIPHRYSLMERLFHKSISKQMAFHTKVPLLALPDNHKTIPAYFL